MIIVSTLAVIVITLLSISSVSLVIEAVLEARKKEYDMATLYFTLGAAVSFMVLLVVDGFLSI